MINHEITLFLQTRGASLVGFADLGELTAGVRFNFPYGISVGVALEPDVIASITQGPNRAYLELYRRANLLLDELGNSLATFLRERGYRARALAATGGDMVDQETESTPLPHKTVATRAGLGWIGKNALLITQSFGSALRLTTVLTDADLVSATPINTSHCGQCVVCVEACPAGAPSGLEWRLGLHRDQFFDAFACRAMAEELCARNLNSKETICGICIAVCPWTRRYTG